MSRFMQFHRAGKNRFPIAQYLQLPEVSTRVAIQPLTSLVQRLSDELSKAKRMHRRSMKHGLTDDESAALYLYLDSQGLQRALNRAMQDDNPGTIEPWLGFLRILHTALAKLPDVRSTIWCVVEANAVNRLLSEKEIIQCSIVSCLRSKDLIERQLFDRDVVCSIEAVRGKDVREYAPVSSGTEVLLPFGTPLRVKSKQIGDRTSRAIIHLEEVSAPSATTQAVVMFRNGDRYHLSYVSGQKQGHGVYRPVVGGQLLDRDADEMACGEGICNRSDGTRFLGEFSRGLRHGYGIVAQPDGAIEMGYWHEDKLCEQFTREKSARGYDVWRAADNQLAPYRVYEDNDGNRFIGKAANCEAYGLGIRVWKDTSRYEGSFENGKKHGYGRYIFPSGSIYLGEWVNDKMEGKGTFTWASGTVFTGLFKNGRRDGQG